MKMHTIYIDSESHLERSDAKVFFDFLKAQYETFFFKKGQTVILKNPDYKIVFGQTMIFGPDHSTEECNNDRQPVDINRYRCDLLGNIIGEGSSAKVYEVEKKLISTSEQLLESPLEQPQVIKWEQCCCCEKGEFCLEKYHRSKDLFLDEYEISRKMPHLNVRPLISSKEFVDDRIVQNYFFHMNKIVGEDLSYLLDNENSEDKTTTPLTASKRLDLAHLLCVKIRAIHLLNIIHGDINPSNIHITLDPLDINIIDFGISVALPNDQSFVMSPYKGGTICYTANEMHEAFKERIVHKKYKRTTKEDVFALGRILLQLFGGQDQSYDDFDSYYSWLQQTKTEQFHSLFFHLTSEERGILNESGVSFKIKQLVEKMLEKNPKKRISSEQAVKEMDKICSLYRAYEARLTSALPATARVTPLLSTLGTFREQQPEPTTEAVRRRKDTCCVIS